MKYPPKVILLLEATRGFDRGLLRGISRYVSLQGPWILYREPPGYMRGLRNRSLLARMKAWHPHGIICPATRLREARELGKPCVIFGVNQEVRDFPSITSDNAGAGRMAAQHLVGTGLRSFAFCGLDDMQWSRQRCEAFCRELSGRGMAPHVFQQPRVRADRLFDREQPFLKKWLRSLPRPTGLLCANDDRAAVIAEMCRVMGFRVPGDFAIIGVDNDEFVCELGNPPLTSVTMGTDRAGYEAASLLHRIMTGREKMKGQKIMAYATAVVPRHSTDILTIGDDRVREALRFISQNAGRLISAGDVVEAAKLSHRTLNDRFHATIGHSILQEINRVRALHISRLLLETNLSIKQIARNLGYSSNAHIARYFERITGLTPLAFRRKHGQ